MTTNSKTEESDNLAERPIRARWGDALNGGFVVIPNVLLRKQAELKLDCDDLAVLANLFASWWKEDEFPFPRTSTLAYRTGLSTRTVQRRVKRLETLGLLQRIVTKTRIGEEVRTVTRYDLGGIVTKLKELGAGAPLPAQPPQLDT